MPVDSKDSKGFIAQSIVMYVYDESTIVEILKAL